MGNGIGLNYPTWRNIHCSVRREKEGREEELFWGRLTRDILAYHSARTEQNNVSTGLASTKTLNISLKHISSCQKHQPQEPTQPLKPTSSQQPWQHLGADS